MPTSYRLNQDLMDKVMAMRSQMGSTVAEDPPRLESLLAIRGMIEALETTEDEAAIVDVPRGDGRVVLFATNPCYRWQNHGEFTMLFNTILHYNDLDAAATPAEAALQD